MITRASIIRLLCVVALACGLQGVTASVASACDSPNKDHCYGRVFWAKSATGATDTINVDCLHSPTGDPDRFITSELWVQRETSSLYWTEEGMVFGGPWFSDPFQRRWFWADHRPADDPGQVNVHPAPSAGDNLNQDYKIGISQNDDAPSQWFVRQDGDQVGVSTQQFSAAANELVAGSETSANISRTQMHAKALQWRGSQGDWNDGWEDNDSHAQKDNVGTGYATDWVNQFGHFTVDRNEGDC